MFGVFKTPANTRDLFSDFSALRSTCPAASYMFAHAFSTALACVQVPNLSARQRKGYVDALLQQCIQTFGVDKGSRMLAVQCVSKIADSAPGGWDRFPADDHIIGTANATERHRDLAEEDSRAPPAGLQREFIEYAGLQNLADFVALKVAEMPEDADDEERDFDYGKTIAVYDIIAEWESGELKTRLAQIDKWIKT